MTPRLIVTSLAVALAASFSAKAADQTGAETQKTPVSAKVVDTLKDPRLKIGNIEVTYADGTMDRWTTKGNTGDPRVAPNGTVGWTIYGPEIKIAASYTVRPNNTVVICRRGKVLCRVESAGAHVEDWSFISNGAQFVLKTRGNHGPASVELHDTATGKLIETTPAWSEGKLPTWAEPFRE